MYRRPAMARRRRTLLRLRSHRPSLPIALLAVISLLSLGARVAWLGQPCFDHCRSSRDRLLVFDEAYYVNAARVIAGIVPPRNQNYADTPLGDDPNAEHPQLAKLMIAGSIELLGDGPLAWRLTSLVLGSLAILGMYGLARAAGGGEWVALGAAALMAADNLLLVHGRIATLDVPVVAAMIWATVLYLRGHPILSGGLLGVGTCIKLVAPYVLLALVVLELLRWLARDGRPASPARVAARLTSCAVACASAFVALLALLDRIAPPYNAAKGKLLASGPFHHIAHMLSYAAHQTSPHGPTGIASYPWAWLVDYKPIVYVNVNPSQPAPGLYDVHPAVHFLGMISPPIMLLAVPALVVAGWRIVATRRDASAQDRASPSVAIVGLAWFLGTFLPFLALSVFDSRTTYLYYMVIVMPGIYLAVSDLLWRGRRYRKLIGVWIVLVIAAAIVMYPFTPLP
jgi:predicted membrane-bound dolichyl-phosphate-mannose-protein mannosyltransferase